MSSSTGNNKLDRALREDEESIRDTFKPQLTSLPEDAAGRRHSYTSDADAKKKNFDQKIYMFPESYNNLRKEIYNNWQTTLWPRCSWYMAHDANSFVEVMNDFLGLKVQFDSQKVEAICQTFLDALILKRIMQVMLSTQGHCPPEKLQ